MEQGRDLIPNSGAALRRKNRSGQQLCNPRRLQKSGPAQETDGAAQMQHTAVTLWLLKPVGLLHLSWQQDKIPLSLQGAAVRPQQLPDNSSNPQWQSPITTSAQFPLYKVVERQLFISVLNHSAIFPLRNGSNLNVKYKK